MQLKKRNNRDLRKKLLIERKKINLELYRLMVETRKFEIENFWKRTLFFWGALTIILIGYFKVEQDYNDYLVFISFIGFIYTLIFSLSIRGSKFWQENWEQKVVYSQEKLKNLYPKELENDFDVFGTPLHLVIKNKESKHFFLHRAYRYSVSKLVLILSDITLLLMFLLLLKDSLKLFNNVSWELFNTDLRPDFKAISFIFVSIVSFIYIVVFLCGEKKRNKRFLAVQKKQNLKIFEKDK